MDAVNKASKYNRWQLSLYQYHRMVKVYFTYKFSQVLGQSISKNCNFIFDPIQKHFIAGVNQYIAIISAKTGEVLHYLHREHKNIPVRHLYVHSGKIYAGYEDGSIVVWSIATQEELFAFDLHKATVSDIALCEEESKMLSAGLDGNIMIWDLLTQQVQAIKSAHPSMITQVEVANVLLKGKPTWVILSVGKDGFFRVWDLNSRICLSAISCQVTEVYCMHLDPIRNLVYIGTNKEEILTIQFNDNLEQSNSICQIRGVFKKKSFARCLQMFVDHANMYVFNADRTIEIYKILTGKDLKARKKRLINRKKKNQEKQEVEQPEEAEAELKFVQQKVIPFKFYNGFVSDSRIFLNNSSDIYQLGVDQQVTYSYGPTLQLCLEYPFVAQRSTKALTVLSSATSTKLFTVPVKASWCHLLAGGYLLIVEATAVCIWNLTKNEQTYRLQEKWVGCWAKKNKCLLWRENEVGSYQIGYDKNKNIKMKYIDSRKFEDKVVEASYKNSMDKYIVNLQNSQIYINYSDTHKNFLKLYGHKLPILSYSLSSDDAVLATGSVDKDIRLWDMDFGHSIKSIFAHQQAVTVVRFIPETHYLLSGSKDSHIKFWDMDTYQLIMDLEENTMEIKDLIVSQAGDIVFAGGLDEGIRVWKQTNDQTIASDMEEKQMDKVMIEDYAREKLDQQEQKTRYEDLKHGQQIIQSLQNKQTPRTVINLLKRIPPANLKSCLSFLHQRHVNRLSQYLKLLIKANVEQQTCWRVVKQLDRGSQLGQQMRQIWRPVQKIIQLNTQILKTWLKQIKEENQMIV